jgi:hypothetical protein
VIIIFFAKNFEMVAQFGKTVFSCWSTSGRNKFLQEFLSLSEMFKKK